MNQALVTIGLTTFNAARTVERALASALAQTWRPIEIVAVDDHSSDGTPEILERLAHTHAELRIFIQPSNGGVAVSRNRILQEARGEFIAFFDDDDESAPERIEQQVRRLVAYEQEFAQGAPVACYTARRRIYAVHGDRKTSDGADKILDRIEPTIGQGLARRAPHGLAVAHRILMGTPLEDGYGACPTCSQMARLATYRQVGGFDPALRRGEDTDFVIRLAQAGGHFVGIAQPLVTQWMTKTSDKSLAEEYRNWMTLMYKHRPIMDAEGQYDFCRLWLHAKQLWLERRRVSFGLALLALAWRHPLLTTRRSLLALPHRRLNLAFSRFHGAR